VKVHDVEVGTFLTFLTTAASALVKSFSGAYEEKIVLETAASSKITEEDALLDGISVTGKFIFFS